MYLKRFLNTLKRTTINCNSFHRVDYRKLCISEKKVPLKLADPHRLNRYRLRFVQSVAVSLGRRQFDYSGFFSKGNTTTRYYSILPDTTTKMPEEKPFQRLPENVKPKHYQLSLVPDLKTLTFQGDVSIQIEVGLFYSLTYAGLVTCIFPKISSIPNSIPIFTSIHVFYLPVFSDRYTFLQIIFFNPYVLGSRCKNKPTRSF